jgi:hypothetical protein
MRLIFQLTIRRPTLAGLFWRNVRDVLRHNPGALEQALMNMALYLHLGPFSRHVVRELDRQIAEVAPEDVENAPVAVARERAIAS